MISGCLFVFSAKNSCDCSKTANAALLSCCFSYSFCRVPGSSYGGSSKQQQAAKGLRREEMHIAKKRGVETALFNSKVADAKLARAIGDQFSPVRTALDRFAGGGARTHTALRPLDFESSASANSATPALRDRSERIRDSCASSTSRRCRVCCPQRILVASTDGIR
jgi:hypothetical protein